jgi:hypothetical protein
VPPIDWRTDIVLTGALRSSPPDVRAPKRRLRIAVMRSDNYFEPVPACRRAVEEAAQALASRVSGRTPPTAHRPSCILHPFDVDNICSPIQGHEVVPFELPVDGSKLVNTYIRLMSADGNW